MKNIRSVLIVLSVVFFSVNIFSMRMTGMGKAKAKRFLEKQDLLKKKEFETRNLLIFLDDLEKEPGAIGAGLLTAIYDEVCPIIASVSLLYALREEAKKDTRPIDILLNDMLLAYSEDRADDFKKQNIITACRIGFKIERWIIKKINESLVLLIPKTYLETLNISNRQVEDYDKNLELSSGVELKLGLKVNHMETIAIEQINKPKESQFADYFVEEMGFIFCLKSDYRIAKLNSCEWVIYISGHGRIDTMISGLSLNGLQQFLNFLEHKIKTQLLMYESCFGVGVNSDKIFGTMKSQVKIQYSFPIIVTGINDVGIGQLFPNIDINEWREKKEIKVDVWGDFIVFLKIAEKINKGEYKDLFYDRFLQNIPQIKLPGIEWFSTDIANKEIVSIGSILAKTHDPQKALDIVSFFKKDPEIILLYTDDIPFELVINSNKAKVIFSMISEFVIHRIKKISSKTHDFMGILHWFRFTGLARHKFFFIDEIDNNKDILIYGEEILSVVDTNKIGIGEYVTKIYYKDHNDDVFMAIIKDVVKTQRLIQIPILFNKIDKGSYEEKEYQEKIEMCRMRYPQLKSEMEKGITPEQIKKIESIYPEQKGKQEYEEITQLYPNVPSWLRSWLIWWNYGK